MRNRCRIEAHSVIIAGQDIQLETPDLVSVYQLASNPTFFEDKKIPLQFTIKMSPPRYYPTILKRDDKGRIITSKFPLMNYKQLSS